MSCNWNSELDLIPPTIPEWGHKKNGYKNFFRGSDFDPSQWASYN